MEILEWDKRDMVLMMKKVEWKFKNLGIEFKRVEKIILLVFWKVKLIFLVVFDVLIFIDIVLMFFMCFLVVGNSVIDNVIVF